MPRQSLILPDRRRCRRCDNTRVRELLRSGALRRYYQTNMYVCQNHPHPGMVWIIKKKKGTKPMKKKVIMALLLGLCVTATGYTGAYASETETETVAETETAAAEDTTEAATEASSEAETTAETEALGDEPDYKALDYVTLGQYKGLEVTVSSLDVTEDDIQQQYYDDCNTNDKLLEVTEGEVAEGDEVISGCINMSGLIRIRTTKEFGESTVSKILDLVEFDGGTDKGVDLTIGSGTFIPGFEDGLIGAAIGKEVNVNVTFPENYRNTDVAGKDAVFAVTVNFVKKTPEMTDDIVSEISSYTTVDEYRQGVEEQLKADKETQQNSESDLQRFHDQRLSRGSSKLSYRSDEKLLHSDCRAGRYDSGRFPEQSAPDD